MLDVARAETVGAGDASERHVRTGEISQDGGLDGIEASGGKPSMGRELSDISVRAETKRNEIEQVLSDGLVCRGVELWPEPVPGLDLMQQQFHQIRPRSEGQR